VACASDCLSQEEILQHNGPFPSHKRATADLAGYLAVSRLRPSFNFDDFIKRFAIRACEWTEYASRHCTAPQYLHLSATFRAIFTRASTKTRSTISGKGSISSLWRIDGRAARRSVSGRGGDRLRGWLFQPEGKGGRRPAISMAHGYAGVKEQGLERFARAFAEAGFVVLLHDHRNSGRATARSVTTSIHGARSAIGGELYPFSNLCRKLIPTASAFGARATRAATCWSLARPTAGSVPLSRRCRRSAATSRGCVRCRPTLSPRWNASSMRMSAGSSRSSRHAASKSSATILRSRHPIEPRMPFLSISGRCRFAMLRCHHQTKWTA
jgi:hypothetical protein